MELSVILNGDERLAENLILEVQAIAKRHGLDISTTRVIRKAALGTRTAKLPRAGKRRIRLAKPDCPR
jgi:hypothetical protein